MSKKTKKQKIIADLRRQVQSAQKIAFTPSSFEPQNLVEKSEKTQKNSEKTALNLNSQNDTIYLYPIQLVRKDLTKTFLLCILAISFEIALYFILEKNFALPIKIK